jgi:ArsR family transcriptional regulator, arsenate/arsenite/antimonite-responsive transcriptional repressor
VDAPEKLFAALADRTRLRLLNLIGNQEVCVCYLVEILELPQPTISRHLAFLRRSGLVAARRQGKWMHYRVSVPADPSARAVLRDILHWLSAHEEMRRDCSRLKNAHCAPRKFVQLRSAPVPKAVERRV